MDVSDDVNFILDQYA